MFTYIWQVTDESGSEQTFTVVQSGTYLPVKRHQTFRIGQEAMSVSVLLLTVASPEAEPQPLGQVSYKDSTASFVYPLDLFA